MKGKGLIVIIVLLLIGWIAGSCEGDPHPGSTIDWGPNYYWDTNSNTVQRKPWK